jgi:SpoVK/Ycf46/Vps4 family AAA+-type ATPase
MTLQQTIDETCSNVRAGVCAIHIASDDYIRIDDFAGALAQKLGLEPVEWNFGLGLVEFGNKRVREDKALADALKGEMYDANQAAGQLFLIKNARMALDGEGNGKNLAQLQQAIIHIKKFNHDDGNRALIVYTDESHFIPDSLSSLVYYVELPAPSRTELENLTGETAKKAGITLRDGLKQELSGVCSGMSKDIFTQILKKAAQDKGSFNDNVLAAAGSAKKQFVEKSGLLKYVPLNDGMDGVGGLGYLKGWLETKRKAFFDTEGAQKHGVTPAKGILLAGMPGCGKSLSAKAIARFYNNLPLLSLDMGSLMGKYVGESESKLRRALAIAESINPCVLWIDEIEKAFAGLSGDESGVTQRLLGYLLTWLNDKTATIFVVATANDIEVLPPEFLRRGRFDEIFSVDFPNKNEREDIFKIHLKKALKKEPDFDLKELAQKTQGYAGSDIASLVNTAAETAWNEDKELSLEILLTQQQYITPLQKVMADKIERNRQKFGQYKFISASMKNFCGHCGTDLTGVIGLTCPKCGKPLLPAEKEQKEK